MSQDRYARQQRFCGIGKEGQAKIDSGRIAVVGMGALGTASAMLLARAGVGFLRLIDRDEVEYSNLTRQVLYDEEDAREHRQKAEAAAAQLARINSEITVEPVVSDLTPGNIDSLLSGMDVVVDGTDNFPTRYLINEYCVTHKMPWIYGGAIESEGMSMTIMPEGPCFACLTGAVRGGDDEGRTCSTVGVIGMATSMTASIQAAEALKVLIGAPVNRDGLVRFDLWQQELDRFEVHKDPDCPVCGKGETWYLDRTDFFYAKALCGQNAVQLTPDKNMLESGGRDLQDLADCLAGQGKVTLTRYYLAFEGTEASFRLFPDGVAVIYNTTDPGRAKSIYTEYIGN